MSITGRWLLPWSSSAPQPPFIPFSPVDKSKFGSSARHVLRRAGRDHVSCLGTKQICCHSARRRRIPPRLPRFTDLHKLYIFQFEPEPASERWCRPFPHVDNVSANGASSRPHHRYCTSRGRDIAVIESVEDHDGPAKLTALWTHWQMPMSCPLPRQRAVPSNVSITLTRAVILIRWMRQAACVSGLWDFCSTFCWSV
jgi:hypothetical protein